MSLPVSLDRLRQAMADFGPAPYLLTVSDGGRPHAVAVAPRWEGDLLVAAVGSRSAANASARPEVSLLWAPAEAGGYSLIVDGAAQVDEGAAVVRVLPTKAVLHRAPAEGAPPSPTGCASDCVPLTAP